MNGKPLFLLYKNALTNMQGHLKLYAVHQRILILLIFLNFNSGRSFLKH